MIEASPTQNTTTDVRRVSADDFQFYVRQIYRLFRVSTMHMLNNQAVTRLVEQTAVFFGQLREAELDKLNILFVDKTVFVNGQLLKANPEIYNLSIQLATFIQRLGYNELSIAHDVTEDDLRALMNVFVGSWKPSRPEEVDHIKFKRVSLRRVKSEILDLLRQHATTPRERLVRTYASALIVVRHGWQRLLEGKAPALKSIKRVVQQLVKESAENAEDFRLMARMRNMHDDPAGIAVKQAMLSICILRRLTDDARVLVRVALASLYFDLGRPRALGIRSEDTALSGGALPTATPAQRETFAAETVLTGLMAAQMHPDSLERLIVAFETQLLALDPAHVLLPAGASLIDVEPHAVLVARRYAESMAFDIRTQRHMEPGEAITWLTWNCRNQLEVLLTHQLAQALEIPVDAALFTSSPAFSVPAPVEAVRPQRGNRTTSAAAAVQTGSVPTATSSVRAIETGTMDGAADPKPSTRGVRYDPMNDAAPRRPTVSAPDPSAGVEPQLTSALQNSREAEGLMDPFFRTRTGTQRTLVPAGPSGMHSAVEPAPGPPAASTNTLADAAATSALSRPVSGSASLNRPPGQSAHPSQARPTQTMATQQSAAPVAAPAEPAPVAAPAVHPAIEALRVARAITGEHPTVVAVVGAGVGYPVLPGADFNAPAEATDARRQRLAGLATQEPPVPMADLEHHTSQRHPFLGSLREPTAMGTQSQVSSSTHQRLAALVHDTTSSRVMPAPSQTEATVAVRPPDLATVRAATSGQTDQATVFRPVDHAAEWLRPPTGPLHVALQALGAAPPPPSPTTTATPAPPTPAAPTPPAPSPAVQRPPTPFSSAVASGPAPAGTESERTVFVRPSDRLLPERPILTGGVMPGDAGGDEEEKERKARIEALLAKYRPK